MTSMGAADARMPRVLVVEDRAHLTLGHFPTRFAELAEGFAEAGCSVEALTADGWLHAGERPVPFVVSRFHWFAAHALPRRGGVQRRRGLERFSTPLRTIALVRAARAAVREAGDPRPLVVVVSSDVDPILGCERVREGAWLFYEFEGPPERQSRRRVRRAKSAPDSSAISACGSRHPTTRTVTRGRRSHRSSNH